MGAIESHRERALASPRQRAGLVVLPIAGLGPACDRRAGMPARRWRADPMWVLGGQPVLEQQRMIGPLNGDQRIRLGFLFGNVPRRWRVAASAADIEAMALADRVERDSLVLNDAGAD